MIPSQAMQVSGTYLAFRRDYFTEEEVERVSEDFGELEKLLESKKFPDEVVPLCWWNDMMDRADRQKTIEAGHFAVWYVGEIDILFEKNREKLFLWQMPYANQSSVTGAGVSKYAKQKEEALQLLTLLYTEEEYANLLIYGEEGKDYQVLDGFVCNMRGEPLRNYYYCHMAGLYNNVLLVQLDDYPISRKQTKDELYYSDARKKNVLLGFHIDNSTFDEQMLSLHSVVWDTQYLWMEENFEEAWDAAAQAFLEAGGEKVVAELERQIEEWKKKR